MDILDAINEYLEENQEDSRRPHLGASVIGNQCDRAIWYSFRWVKTVKHEGRILRLFNRGHKEEERIVEWLRNAEYQVNEFDADGLQYRVSEFNGVFGGSLDGIIKHKGQWKLLEFKTHNKKSFDALEKKGVTDHKPEHCAQMQIYMHLSPQIGHRITNAIYISVCKDDDRIYIEEVKYNKDEAVSHLNRAKGIIESDVPPTGVSSSPAFFKCKFCDFKNICHSGELSEVTCRTCVYFDASEGIVCKKYNYSPTNDEQKKGCKKHIYIPALIPVKQVDIDDATVVYENGLRNGPDGRSSKDIYKFGVDGDDELVKILKNTDGEIVGDV